MSYIYGEKFLAFEVKEAFTQLESIFQHLFVHTEKVVIFEVVTYPFDGVLLTMIFLLLRENPPH